MSEEDSYVEIYVLYQVENSEPELAPDPLAEELKESDEWNIKISLTDRYGDGWNGAEMKIYNDVSQVVFDGSNIDVPESWGVETTLVYLSLNYGTYNVDVNPAGSYPAEVSFSIARATPPFADPSSLVIIKPVTLTASQNVNAWLIPF